MHIRVRVKTGMRKESVIEISPRVFAVGVKEKAEGGKANARVVALIAQFFGVPQKEVRIVSGHTRPSKMLTIR